MSKRVEEMVTAVPRQLPHQQQLLVSDKDRQIAVLEVKVQKMMMEVERREAIVREQARVLTVQMEKLREEEDEKRNAPITPAVGTAPMAPAVGTEPMTPAVGAAPVTSDPSSRNCANDLISENYANREEVDRHHHQAAGRGQGLLHGAQQYGGTADEPQVWAQTQ